MKRNKQKQIDQEHQFELNLHRKYRILRDAEYKKLMTMDDNEFEHYIADLFRLKGYEAEVTSRTGDGGKDIILRHGDKILLVECNHYTTSKVTRPLIQKFHSALIDMDAKEGFYFTTGYFTQPAMEYVLDKPIRLIDLPRLLDLIEEIKNKGELNHNKSKDHVS
jgi:restriction endonuclease Mrr